MLEFRLSWNTDHHGAAKYSPPEVGADIYLPLSRLPDGLRSGVVTHIKLVVASDGKVENCEVATSSGSLALDKAACEAIVKNGVPPLSDATGAPVRAVQSMAIGFTRQP